MSLLFWQSLKGSFLSAFLADEVSSAEAEHDGHACAQRSIGVLVAVQAMARQQGVAIAVVHASGLLGSATLEQTAIIRVGKAEHT